MVDRTRPYQIGLRVSAAERDRIRAAADATGAANMTDAILAALDLAQKLGLNIPDPARPDIWCTRDAAADAAKNLLS